jgi:hypothetical protein
MFVIATSAENIPAVLYLFRLSSFIIGSDLPLIFVIGPFTTYALVEEDKVKFTGMGQFRAFQSSEECIRYFCKQCGSPLATQVVATRQYKVPLARFQWHGNQARNTIHGLIIYYHS